MTYCRNVRKVERCLNWITSDVCSASVSEQWEGPLKTWADKCGDIGKYPDVNVHN